MVCTSCHSESKSPVQIFPRVDWEEALSAKTCIHTETCSSTITNLHLALKPLTQFFYIPLICPWQPHLLPSRFSPKGANQNFKSLAPSFLVTVIIQIVNMLLPSHFSFHFQCAACYLLTFFLWAKGLVCLFSICQWFFDWCQGKKIPLKWLGAETAADTLQQQMPLHASKGLNSFPLNPEG